MGSWVTIATRTFKRPELLKLNRAAAVGREVGNLTKGMLGESLTGVKAL